MSKSIADEIFNDNRTVKTVQIGDTTMQVYTTLDAVKSVLADNSAIRNLDIHPVVKDMLLKADKDMLMENAENHFAKISTHCAYVKDFCEQAGIGERGAVHDLSKFSPQEIFESILFFEGYRSPIDRANEELGWSPAFAHHVRYNEHHLEHSIYLNGGLVVPYEKDFQSSVECVCDFCGAAKAYLGEDEFSMEGELEWWQCKLQQKRYAEMIHENTKEFITCALEGCAEKDRMLHYNKFVSIWNELHRDNEIFLENFRKEPVIEH